MTKKKENELKVVDIRLVKEPSLYSTEKIATPDDVLKVIAKELSTYDREVFAILNLKSNGQMMSFKQDGLMPQLERDNGWER